MDAWQEIQLDRLLKAQTDVEFLAALTTSVRELGFDHVGLGVRSPFPLSQQNVGMLSSYSEQWQQRYLTHNYMTIDPTVRHCMRSSTPLVWTEQMFDPCREFWEEARSHGVEVGWTRPSHTACGVSSMLSLARSHNEISASELSANSMYMAWITQVAHEGISRLWADKLLPGRDVALTDREIEVMRWTAEGKTAAEISAIMRIAKGTVNFHISNAAEKLGAPNKTAAAIKAVILIAGGGASQSWADELLHRMEVKLTDRETEIMKWTAEGKTSAEISDIMNIAFGTVNFHIGNAVSKLGVTNKTAAAIKSVALKLI